MGSIGLVGIYTLCLFLVSVLVVVMLMQQQKSGQTVAIWAASGLVGLLLGAAASIALINGLGYEIVAKPAGTFQATDEEMAMVQASAGGGTAGGGSTPTASPTGGPAGGGGPGGGGPGGAGGGPGGGGPGGFGGPGAFTPPPKRQLVGLVQKLALLTGDVGIELSAEQSEKLSQVLSELKSAETMTDDEAKAKYDEIMGLLDENQKQKEAAIALPRGGRGPGGPGRGGPGGPPAPDDKNPFGEDEEGSKALATLEQQVAE